MTQQQRPASPAEATTLAEKVCAAQGVGLPANIFPATFAIARRLYDLRIAVWATLLLLLSAATVVTTVFAVVIALLLTCTVFELVFRHAGQDAAATVPARARAGPG